MEKLLKWVDINEEHPTSEGKYIVKTLTKMGNSHVLESKMTINKKKVHFNVTNQIVTHWLKEI